jgi:putative isomerase
MNTKRIIHFHFFLLGFILLINQHGFAQYTPSAEYTSLQQKLCKGWNTWSYGSMASHVLLPEGLALKVNLRLVGVDNSNDGKFVLSQFTWTKEKSQMIQPIAHSFDGAYTEFVINDWKGNKICFQSAASVSNNIVILITPVTTTGKPYTIELETGIMWNRAGTLQHKGDFISATFTNSNYEIRATAPEIQNIHPYLTPSIICEGTQPLAFYTGAQRTLESIKAEIAQAKTSYLNYANKYGENAEAFRAMQTSLGWNTIYDAEKDRIITPVTRRWNERYLGYVLFNWDTYFASLLYAFDNKEYAYATVFSVTNGRPESDHVEFLQKPRKPRPLSPQTQPPVGSMVCWMIYDKYKEDWFLREVYNKLLSWNRWWLTNRLNKGYLTWSGNTPHAAALESGLDNSPMYEDSAVKVIPVGKNSLLNLADVGLTSLYVADCKYLAKIAKALGHQNDEKELLDRAETFSIEIKKLWSEKDGIFLNKYTDTEQFSKRLSPTLFYPMLAGIPTKKQAERMLKEHYFNPAEFYGKYIIPSCPYNDPNYNNDYWRGSIWGPMNFLVYLGLKKYDAKAATELADRSYTMFLDAWKANNKVLENINSEFGASDFNNQKTADPLYHWGALMGLMKMMESK